MQISSAREWLTLGLFVGKKGVITLTRRCFVRSLEEMEFQMSVRSYCIMKMGPGEIRFLATGMIKRGTSI